MTTEKGKEKGKSRGLLVLDVNDHIDPTTRGWVTVDEDGNQIRTPEGDAMAAELGARFEAWLLARDDLNADQVRLLRMLSEVIKANAADLESVESWRFMMPPFSGMGGRRMVETVFGGAAQLGAVLSGMNTAVFLPESPHPPQSEVPPPEAPRAPI